MTQDKVEYLIKLHDQMSGTLAKVQVGLAKADQATKGLQENVKKLGSKFSGLKVAAGAALATLGTMAVSSIINFGRESMVAFDEAEAAGAQLNATLESTKYAAGLSREALDQHADALAKVTLFDDDAITGMQSLLLTFTNIKGEVFENATPAILDLATKMGGDLKGAAIQVGKALNDPAEGISALTRSGVTFSDQQKAVIKSLVETGQVAMAQGMILAELNKEFGGSAEAAAKAGTGPLQMLTKRMDELRETFGGFLYKMLMKMQPYIEKFIGAMERLVGAATSSNWSKFLEPFKIWYNLIKEVFDMFVSLARQLGIINDKTSTFQAVINGLGFVMKAILLPLRLFVWSLKKFVDFIQAAIPAVVAFGYGVKQTFLGIGKLAKDIFGSIGDLIIGVFTLDQDKIKNAVGNLKKAFTDYGQGIGKAFNEGYEKYRVKDSPAGGVMQDLKKTALGKFAERGPGNMNIDGPGNRLSNARISTGSASIKEAKNTVINISMGSLNSGAFNITTNNITEAAGQVQEKIVKAMIAAINDGQIIATS